MISGNIPTAAAAVPTPTKLSRRLMEIVSFVPHCRRVLDVGSDHGHVISYLLENHIAETAVATDIHADPAETTQRYLRRQCVMHLAEVYHADGLHDIRLSAGDVVIISGLGGLEMIRILSNAISENDGKLPDHIQWILQPQRSFEELRSSLSKQCFQISRETICLDRDKFYCIIQAEWTGQICSDLTLTEQIIGPCLLVKRPDHFAAYLHHQRNVLKKHMRARPELAPVLSDIDRILQGEKSNEEVDP